MSKYKTVSWAKQGELVSFKVHKQAPRTLGAWVRHIDSHYLKTQQEGRYWMIRHGGKYHVAQWGVPVAERTFLSEDAAVMWLLHKAEH